MAHGKATAMVAFNQSFFRTIDMSLLFYNNEMNTEINAFCNAFQFCAQAACVCKRCHTP